MHSSSKAIPTIYKYFSYLCLDKRSLAFFRIVLGLSILYNLLVVKWQFLLPILGSDPLLPFELLDKISKGLDYSIFDIEWFRTDSFLTVFKFSYLIAAICFTTGIFPRYMAIAILFLQFNLIQAASAFLTGIDFLNLNLILWSIFLPINEYVSIYKSKKTENVSLPVSFVLLLQIGCLYLFSMLFKWGIPWKEGFAAYYMLLDTMNAWGVANFLSAHQPLYQFITYSTLAIEGIVIFLIFIKWNSNQLRLLASILIFTFHTLIFLSSDVSGFSISGWAIAFLLIPGNVYNKLGFKLKPQTDVYQHSVYKKRILLALTVFASIVIVQRNFNALYRSYDDVIAQKHLKTILIPSFAKASFFHQYWSMYAPNPPEHIGSFAIVEKVKNIDDRNIEATYVYNSLDKKLNDWETAILYLLRQNIIDFNDKKQGINAFSFWLKWRINQLSNFTGDYSDYIFLENRVLVDLDKFSENPQKIGVYYFANDVIEGNFTPINMVYE